MITKITDVNKYRDLFSRAWKELSQRTPEQGGFTTQERAYYGAREAFTNLEEYFTKLRSLMDTPNPNYEYVMLPVDEERLEINANTREISIPAGFKRLVGVQGDHLAETLIFSIDRFFDYVDLYPGANRSMQIYIQWTDEEGQDRADPINMIHYDAEKQKVLFGWPLSSKVTRVARNIPFSVRFFVQDETNQKITYSFNTKTHQITIAPALKATLDNVMIDDEASSYVLNALSNSSNTNAPPAEAPYFQRDLLETLELTQDSDYILKVQAVTRDAGWIDYLGWYKDGSPLTTNVSFVYEEAVNPEESNTTIYYVNVGTNLSPNYVIYSGAVPPAEDSGIKLYQKYYQYEIPKVEGNAVGQYCAKAQNRTGINTSAIVSSKICTIEPPTDLSITSDLSSGAIITDENTGISLSATFSNPDGNKTTVAYKWTKKTSDNGDTDVIEGATTNTLNAIKEAGWYQISATGSRNLSKTSECLSTICKVTKLPEAPTITETWKKEGDTNSTNLVEDVVISGEENKKVYLTVTIDDEIVNSKLRSESIEYEWLVEQLESDVMIPLTESIYNDYGVEKIETADNSLSSTLTVFSGNTRVYQCTVYNTLNGRRTGQPSKVFTVS